MTSTFLLDDFPLDTLDVPITDTRQQSLQLKQKQQQQKHQQHLLQQNQHHLQQQQQNQQQQRQSNEKNLQTGINLNVNVGLNTLNCTDSNLSSYPSFDNDANVFDTSDFLVGSDDRTVGCSQFTVSDIGTCSGTITKKIVPSSNSCTSSACPKLNVVNVTTDIRQRSTNDGTLTGANGLLTQFGIDGKFFS